MNAYKVLFFATLKERAGVHQTTLELPDGITVHALKDVLRAQFPSLKSSLTNALIAVNREYALDEDLIPPEAEIAIFPPVSGGSLKITG